MSREESRSRIVREVIGLADLPRHDRAREVIAEYEDGSHRREIEVEQNGKYVARFREIDDE